MNQVWIFLNDSGLPSTGEECDHGLADMSFEDEVCIPLPRLAVRSGPREKIYFDPSKVWATVFWYQMDKCVHL